MSDAGFVIAAWVITALVLGGYVLRIALRVATARGEKILFRRVASTPHKSKDGVAQ